MPQIIQIKNKNLIFEEITSSEWKIIAKFATDKFKRIYIRCVP